MSITNPTQVAADFNAAFEFFPQVDYDPSWANGTGYFDPLTRVKLENPIAFTDDKGRKVVAVPNNGEGGNIVFFQRYTDNDQMIVVHMPNVQWDVRSYKFVVTGSTSTGAWEAKAAPMLNMLDSVVSYGRYNRSKQAA